MLNELLLMVLVSTVTVSTLASIGIFLSLILILVGKKLGGYQPLSFE